MRNVVNSYVSNGFLRTSRFHLSNLHVRMQVTRTPLRNRPTYAHAHAVTEKWRKAGSNYRAVDTVILSCCKMEDWCWLRELWKNSDMPEDERYQFYSTDIVNCLLISSLKLNGQYKTFPHWSFVGDYEWPTILSCLYRLYVVYRWQFVSTSKPKTNFNPISVQ